MAKGNLNDAINYSRENPNTDFARMLKQRILSGDADQEAQQLGIDLSWAGRKPLPTSTPSVTEAPTEESGYFSRVAETIKTNVQDAKNKIASMSQTTDPRNIQQASFRESIGTGLNIAKNVTGAAAAPIVQSTPFKAMTDFFNMIGQPISDELMKNKVYAEKAKQFADFLDTNPEISDAIETAGNIGLLEGVARMGPTGKQGVEFAKEKIIDPAKDVTSKVVGGVKNSVEGVKEGVKGVIDDVVPGAERLINHEVTRALNLTQGDARNIHLSTKNEPGRFLADKNLIGKTVEETEKNLGAYFDQNYKQVREEINSVKRPIDPIEIPAYEEALTEILTRVSGKPGLKSVEAEIKGLLDKTKSEIILKDVQRAKELVDSHFELYKVTGDVMSGVEKQGIRNLRNDLKKYIEDTVEKETGADIREMNNNVATSRTLIDTIETRSTRGLTRSHFSLSDITTFFGASMLASPAGGVLAVILKKVYDSPSVKLKVSKWLDGMTDASKERVKASLEKGEIPPEVSALQSSISETIEAPMMKSPINKPPSNDSIPTTIQQGDEMGKLIPDITVAAEKQVLDSVEKKGYYASPAAEKAIKEMEAKQVELSKERDARYKEEGIGYTEKDYTTDPAPKLVIEDSLGSPKSTDPACVKFYREFAEEHPDAKPVRGVFAPDLEAAVKLYKDNVRMGNQKQLGGFTHIKAFEDGKFYDNLDNKSKSGDHFFSEEGIKKGSIDI